MSNLLPILTTLPGRLDGIVESIERGELSLVLRHLGTDRERQFVTRLAVQLTTSMVTAAIGGIGALLAFSAGSQAASEAADVVRAVGLGCVGVSLLVLFRVLVTALRATRGAAP